MLAVLVAASCKSKKDDPALAAVVGDPARGHAAMERFECSRCHRGAELVAAAPDKQCIQCHNDILAGRTVAPTEAMEARWRERVAGLGDAPSLEATGARFRRRWIVGFLQKPHDLRPLLVTTMPRLALAEADAKDIAAYLVPSEDPIKESLADDELLEKANPAMGRELMVNKGCGTCHVMTGVPSFSGAPLPVGVVVDEPARAMTLAPDLRFTRQRMTASKLARWVKNPKAVKADTMMPTIPLTDVEARHIAAYILGAPLADAPKKATPARLANLDREVTFDEVRDKVFRRTCWHCHSDPDLEIGDTGPGNTGGFGFAPRRLDLHDYEGVFAGTVDADGQRHSIFAPMPDGTPRIVAVMLARHREEAGDDTTGVRGMPLGLPALSMEDIQLVESWIAQGRKR